MCSYCERLKQESFWGGEVEILVLSRMLKVPIYVFKTAEEAGRRALCFNTSSSFGMASSPICFISMHIAQARQHLLACTFLSCGAHARLSSALRSLVMHHLHFICLGKTQMLSRLRRALACGSEVARLLARR